ncbi:MAG TPA: Wzz/FepE/Etk N-terminal domain-containing protein [Cyclobacteriaceae bacterium]
MLKDHENNSKNSYEIDLLKLIKILWAKRYKILITSMIFIFFGLIIAFTTPLEYETQLLLMPEVKQSGPNFGGLGDLAGLAGVDIGSLQQSGSEFNPELYQKIVHSTPFLLSLMNQRFYFKTADKTWTLFDYFNDHVKVSLIKKLAGLPFELFGFMRYFFSDKPEESMNTEDGAIIKLSEEQKEIVEILVDRIDLEIDWEGGGIVIITTEMQDPEVTARMALFTQNYITTYVKEYYVSKELQNLNFIKEQYERAKKEFQRAQIALANFRDNNKNINTAKARSEEERLQSEYNLAFNVYNGLAQQLEQAKIKVNNVTPVFTVLEPAKVPVEKSKPNRVFILILFLTSGVLVGTAIVIGQAFIKKEL